MRTRTTYSRDGTTWSWRKLRRGCRHPGEQSRDCPEALCEVESGPPGPNHEPDAIDPLGNKTGTRAKTRLQTYEYTTLKVVPGVGLEPTLPLPGKGF